MIVTTADAIEDLQVQAYLGIVRGIAVRVPSLRQGFQALGNVLSGNPQASSDLYAEMCEAVRAEAHQRMIDHAKQLGADAIIAMRYESAQIGEAMSELLAYGTAVKLKIPTAKQVG